MMLAAWQRAVARTLPRIAATQPGLAWHGYWLPGGDFFFLDERRRGGRILSEPRLWRVATGSVEPVLGPDRLAALVAGRNADLASISFEMTEEGRLAILLESVTLLVDPATGEVAEEPSLSEPALYSPDHRFAVVCRDHDLDLVDLKTLARRSLTTGGEPLNPHGRQPDSCLSGLDYRRAPDPVGLWSPDSRWFLTHRIDERSAPELPFIRNVPGEDERPRIETTRYPLPADAIPEAVVVAVHVSSGRQVEFPQHALPIWAVSPFQQRRLWFAGDDTAWAVRFDRYGREAELVRFDLAEGGSSTVISETATQGYIDLNPSIAASPNVRVLPGRGEALWYSERDGWGHLYRYDLKTGECLGQLTRGEWQLRSIVDVDEAAGRLLVLAGGLHEDGDSARRSLCAVDLDSGSLQVLIRDDDDDIHVPASEPTGLGQAARYRPSYARAGVSPDRRTLLVRRGNVERGNRAELVASGSSRVWPLASVIGEAETVQARPFSVTAADGKTPLRGVMFLPAEFREERRYPLVDYIYPGPQVAWRPLSYLATKSLPAVALAELGFVTIMLDTRGTPYGSRDFHQCGYGSLFEPQLADHAAEVCELVERHPFLDGARVGIFGYSGGGAAAARAMFDYPHVYKAGVSVCGNHDNRFNTACWADKYCGPTSGTAEPRYSNIGRAGSLEGGLLLISGDLDQNVHVSQTLRLVDALIRAGKVFDMLIVPNAGHEVMFSPYVQQRIWAYFRERLIGGPPEFPPVFAFSAEELRRAAILAASEIPQ